MKAKRLIALVLVLSMVFFAMASCAKDSATENGTADNSNTQAASDKEESNDSTGNDTETEMVKDSLIVANTAEPDTWFPFHSTLNTNMSEVPILHNIYDTPLKMMPDGSKVGLLAETWDISEDGMEYTLHLREGVTFSNGNPFNADDIVFSLDGAAATPAGKTLLINYDYSEKVDDYTVIVHLTAPYGAFENSLSSRYALIVDKEYFDEVGEDGYNEAPVGTGPYMLGEVVSGDYQTYEANPNYWGEEVAIKHITYKYLGDVNTQILALENGEVDVMINADVGQLKKLPEDSPITFIKAQASSMCKMDFNCAKGPAADINFRKAIQYAINKEEVILGAYEGEAIPIDFFMIDSTASRPDDSQLIEMPTFDLAKAEEYLAASNYNGEEFKIIVTSGRKDELAAQIIQGQLLALGINCTVSALDAGAYFDALRYSNGDYSAALRENGVSIVDADGYSTYYDPKRTSEDRYDPGRFSDYLTDLLDNARIAQGQARADMYAEMVNYITDEAYEVCLYSGLSVAGYNKDLTGIIPRPLTGLWYFSEWSWQ